MRVAHISVGLAGLALAACSSGTPLPASMGPSPVVQAVVSAEPRELLPDEQIQQVLNRLGFGPRPGDVAKVRAMGVDRWIDQQLHPERIDDGGAQTLAASYPTLGVKTDELVRNFQIVQQAQRQIVRMDSVDKRDARREVNDDPALVAARREAQRVVPDLQSMSLARAVASERQSNEVMVDFWENHFSVF